MSEPMTKRQSWAIFCLSGVDVREKNFDKAVASNIIWNLKDGHEIYHDGINFVPKKKKAIDYQELFNKADKAGKEAAENHNPTPMHVVERENPLDDSSPIVKRYEPVADGVCGFAWVNFSPGTHGFCRWLKANTNARKAYYGGIELWIYDYNQSMEKKQAYATAFAKIINEEIGSDKFRAMPGSRMD